MEKDQMIKDVVDRLDKLGHIPDLLTKGGLAYLGYKATGNIGGAITALVGLKLATGNNLAGGAAGVAALTLIGLKTAFKPAQSYNPDLGLTHEQWCALSKIQGYNPPGCP